MTDKGWDERFRELERTHNHLLNIAETLSLRTSLTDLLSELLRNFRNSVNAEAGSIFLVERPTQETPIEECSLAFHVSQNDRVKLPTESGIRLPINSNSISGYIAITKETLNIPDVYDIANKPFSYNSALDKKLNYRCCSMLATPMINKDGQIIGVLMLINCLRNNAIVPFPYEYEKLVKFQSVYSGMVIENAQIYHELEKERNSLEIKVRERTRKLEEVCRELKEKDELLHADLKRAREMQLNIIPKEDLLKRIEQDYSIRLFSRYNPCDELGGDFWEIVEIDKNRLGVLVTDFAGHGVSAALNTFQLKSLFHLISRDAETPISLISLLNNHFVDDFANYATGLYMVYHQEESRLTLTRAGHPYPLHFKAKTGELCELQEGGLCLGLFPDLDYTEITVEIEHGDKLFLFTDGLFELVDAVHGRDGYKYFKELLGKYVHLDSREIYAIIEKEMFETTGCSSFQDDVIFLILEKA